MPITYTKLSRDIVEISGTDQRNFLQGLISQDIEKVTSENCVYGTLLTPQGKFLHDFIILQKDDLLVFDCEQGRSADLISRLSRFKLRADVHLQSHPETIVYAVFGDGAAERVGIDQTVGATMLVGDVLLSVDPRTEDLGCRLIGPEASIIKFLQDHDIPEVAFDAYDQRRIARGVPDGTRDLEVEKSILLESNIDELHGIDWEKGCYMGQELTARTKYRGLVKRRLHAFETTVNAAEPGDPILSGDKEVGNVRSTNGNLLLASIRTDALESEKPELSLKDSPLKRIMETD